MKAGVYSLDEGEGECKLETWLHVLSVTHDEFVTLLLYSALW